MIAPPRLSVVVASNRPVELLEACLEALLPQARRVGARVVVSRPGGPELAPLGSRWPEVRFVVASGGADIPELRGIGLADVHGGHAALTEDHCLPDPDWLRCLLDALEAGSDVVGGAMGNARTTRMVDRGAFYAEYGFFATADGEGTAVTAANVAYGAGLVPRVADWMMRGEWEDVVHRRLIEEGRRFRFLTDAVVRQNGTYRIGGFVADRYRHGRDYARVRLREAGGRGRILRLLSSPLLPPVLIFRVCRRITRGERPRFLGSLPTTALFLSAWSVGEAVGYLRGAAKAPSGAAPVRTEPENPESRPVADPPPPEAPVLSVVVPSVNGAGDLMDCLNALEREREHVPLEVLVPDRCGTELRELVRARFPWVRLRPASRDATIPDLRAMAFAEAGGRYVAVIEDHVLVPPGWAAAMLEARRREPGSAVIGGSVENGATRRLVDRAAFVCEYSHLLPELPEGPAEWLTGNNTLYDLDLLRTHREYLGGDRWENELHAALKASGVPLVRRSGVRVIHRKHYTVREYVSQRFLYSRAFAGARLRGRSLPERLAYGMGAVALPPLLLVRVLRNARRGGVGSVELLRMLSLLALFVTAWAAGELVGAWLGAGRAITKVS